ncbi:M60 family metallopeptidase [Pedobacter gandavensis]|uniref:M60 family metallopeptidase n=1 Tax=Pedobacter gandavensis TaxID=2679963 RepID=UPI00247ADFA3|nr:M60 family metallopeptidase [Pedobacter gandavensis]WGQ07638.1 M60 family metallopeptidase [Pedobacter gandavensis]
MKSFNFLFKISCFILIMGLASCKKYGYSFEDGTDKPNDNPLTNIQVDTAMSRVDRSLYPRARVFPGLMEPQEIRLKNQKLVMNFNYTDVQARVLRMNITPEPQFSTGFWAPAGELIQIVLPAGIEGLSVQVGVHTDNLSAISPLRRDPLITTRKQLFPGVNYIRNLYGGTVYINASVAITAPVEVTFTGVVKAPDFVLGETNDADFAKAVVDSSVPWLELRSKNVIFSLPRDLFLRYPLLNPTALMREWDVIIDKDYYEWMGLSATTADMTQRSPDLPWRVILDIQPSVGYAHSNYPVVAQLDDNWFTEFTTLAELKNGGNWGFFHEIGHNCQQPGMWSWGALGETSNNLFVFKGANRNGTIARHPALLEQFPKSLAWAAVSSTPNLAKNFNDNSDAFFKILPFVQIFEKLGYNAMTYLYKAARSADRLSMNDQDRQDFVYEKFSEYAKLDLQTFFDSYNIRLSSLSRKKISSLYPALTTQIWTYNPITKTGGTAAIVPTYTASSSQSNEGSVAAMFDGNTATYWHSQYSPTPDASTKKPFTINMDMKKLVSAKGMSFTPRINSSSQRPKTTEVYTSPDNVNFTLVGTVVIADAATPTTMNFTDPQKARFYRVVIKDMWSTGDYASLSEIAFIN